MEKARGVEASRVGVERVDGEAADQAAVVDAAADGRKRARRGVDGDDAFLRDGKVVDQGVERARRQHRRWQRPGAEQQHAQD